MLKQHLKRKIPFLIRRNMHAHKNPEGTWNSCLRENIEKSMVGEVICND